MNIGMDAFTNTKKIVKNVQITVFNWADKYTNNTKIYK